MVLSDHFQMYNYGAEENLKRYGQVSSIPLNKKTYENKMH